MPRPWVLLLALCVLVACSSTPRSGEPELRLADPQIERLEYAGGKLPSHILTCGLIRPVDEKLLVHSYLDEPPFAMSLYDFGHDASQLNTWMEHSPGGRAFAFRKPPQAGAKDEIGRALTEPCFGNGEEAKNVVRQVVVQRAPGLDARRALDALLSEARSTHFVIDRDGAVFEVLDPVHAAIAPEANANYAIYVALVEPPRADEYLPPLMVEAMRVSTLGLLALPAGLSKDSLPAHDIPKLEERALTSCTLGTQSVLGVPPSPEQLDALRRLVDALQIDYPRLSSELPFDDDGAPIRSYFEGSEYHLGVLAAYHTSPELEEPACLDLFQVFSP
ncbi:MAG: hypothetical protein RBU37_24525 [Myxococcota bacterium]|jgi:hypothetical protein|nr:hypothetical protein [Myxococcota bacterium]